LCRPSRKSLVNKEINCQPADSKTNMQAIYEVAESTQRMIYRLATQTIVVEAQDTWAAKVIERLFAGWYLTPATATRPGSVDASLDASSPASIVIRSTAKRPEIPRGWPQFEIAGSGTCFTDGKTSYIDIEGAIVAIGKSGHAAVEVWTNGMLEIQSPALTRVVTYALGAALRRRCLFELHSGAVIDPESRHGVLIIGPSGSGKSTLTVQLAAADWSFLTDDVLVLGAEGVEIKAWPVRRCFAITSDTFAASNFLRTRTSLDYMQAQPPDKHAKKQFVPHQVFDSEFKEQCLPQSLFFSQLSGDEQSQVLQLSAAETMARLIRMSPWCCYDRTTAAEHLAVLSALVKQSTGYALLAGKDLLDPETAANLIAGFTRD
jgi:ABC-type lipoprotein export system ATPase subunit